MTKKSSLVAEQNIHSLICKTFQCFEPKFVDYVHALNLCSDNIRKYSHEEYPVAFCQFPNFFASWNL